MAIEDNQADTTGRQDNPQGPVISAVVPRGKFLEIMAGSMEAVFENFGLGMRASEWRQRLGVDSLCERLRLALWHNQIIISLEMTPVVLYEIETLEDNNKMWCAANARLSEELKELNKKYRKLRKKRKK